MERYDDESQGGSGEWNVRVFKNDDYGNMTDKAFIVLYGARLTTVNPSVALGRLSFIEACVYHDEFLDTSGDPCVRAALLVMPLSDMRFEWSGPRSLIGLINFAFTPPEAFTSITDGYYDDVYSPKGLNRSRAPIKGTQATIVISPARNIKTLLKEIED